MTPRMSATYRIKPQTVMILISAFEKAGPKGPSRAVRIPASREPSAVDPSRVHGRAAGEKRAAPRAYSLPMTLAACPDIVDYAKGGAIGDWDDFRAAAAIVRPALGVSPDAWAHALDVLGEQDASIVVAAILQRGDEIKSAGGYLRVLTAKAEQGDFSVGPVLMTLLRRRASKSVACRASQRLTEIIAWKIDWAGGDAAERILLDCAATVLPHRRLELVISRLETPSPRQQVRAMARIGIRRSIQRKVLGGLLLMLIRDGVADSDHPVRHQCRHAFRCWSGRAQLRMPWPQDLLVYPGFDAVASPDDLDEAVDLV